MILMKNDSGTMGLAAWKHLWCIVFLLVLLSVTANGQSINTDRDYYIQSQVSGLYLDVYQANKDVGGEICQAIKNPDQVWRLKQQ